jgi:hypothetical protein
MTPGVLAPLNENGSLLPVPFRGAAEFFGRLASKRWLACIVSIAAALVLRAALLPWIPIPEPWVSDEFDYLLGADTFVSGRLANPPHPLWVFFETLHVNQLPTYGPKYPPGQALVLAAGQRIFGHPWFGVWLSAGLMCGAICWMLQGWLPPRSALTGGGLAAVQAGALGYWVNSYYGGAAAALAGSLLLGAIPRIVKSPRPRQLLAAGIGIGMLAFTRPYEGALLTIVCAVATPLWMKSRRRSLRQLLSLRLLLPGGTALVIFLLALGYYNFRATGNALVLPYQVNEAAYSPVPIFLWQSPRSASPEYRNPTIRAYWMDWEAAQYYGWRSRPFLKLASICYAVWRYFLRSSTIALIPILGCLGMWRLPWVRYAFLIWALSLCGQLAVKGPTESHYLAPAAGLFFLFSAGGLRFFSTFRYRNGRRARIFPALIITAWLLSFAAEAAISTNDPAKARAGEYQIPGWQVFVRNRGAILDQLNRDPAHHLVIVRYASGHNVHLEWVYNRASIDESAIVWARDRGAQENRLLVQYFRGRKIWLLNADDEHPRLTPYTTTLEPPRN